MSEKLVIIDGNSIFYRSFYALPLLTNSSGEFSNAVYGFAIQIIHIIQNIKPNYIVVAFDASKKTFRNELYNDYKATRKPMPIELKSQLEPLRKMLELMDIKYVEKVGLEGDDIIGVISNKFDNTENIIVTGDRDSFQLVSNNTKIYYTKKGTSDVKIVDLEELKSEYGVTPAQFIDLKSLQGDSSDNIPGVAGIGPKTAEDLIKNYGDLDNIYNNLDKIASKSLKEKLINGKENAYLSKKLATIITSADLELELNDCKYEFPFSFKVQEFFKHYEFKSLLKNKTFFTDKEDLKEKNNNTSIIYIKDEISLNNICKEIGKNKKFSLFFDKNSFHFSIGTGEIIINLSFDLLNDGLNENEIFNILKPFFEANEIEKICFDSKKDMYKLKEFNIELNNYFDCSIAKYLADGVPVDSVKDILLDDNLDYIADYLFKFEATYKQKIEDENLNYLFYDVELPLSKILFSMENYGFKLDKEVLQDLKIKYSREANELEQQIYTLAGEEFNINSPKQLAKILYEKLGLPHKKKQSTSAEVLQELVGLNDIVEVILRYRKVSKFLSTYIDGLTPHIDKNNLVHTYFKQTLTTTGRLSSVDPNLQNIPIRSEESREIRSMFVASNKDNVLIDADYSQIELRILAHLSGDEIFMNAFLNNIDIHTRTACDIFGVTTDNVTPEMRRTAKIVNFGIIYGISDFGLAEDLKISQKAAKRYITNFYESHPKVGQYMEEQIIKARNTGKATTIFGRIRKMPEINASNYMVRTRAERASQNMPLQGTAADIIKIAMVKTYNALKNSNLKAKLIMQVHDELIIDAPKDEESEVKELLRTQMENAVKLNVPMKVDVKSSYRWSEGH